MLDVGRKLHRAIVLDKQFSMSEHQQGSRLGNTCLCFTADSVGGAKIFVVIGLIDYGMAKGT